MDTLKVTVKMNKATLQLLRLIAAYTGEKQYAILHRLAQQELKRVEKDRA